MDRVAVIDIGSGTTTLAVFEGGRRGFLDRVHQEGESLRLVQKLDAAGRLANGAAKSLLALVRRYHREALALGAERTEVVATSAMRDAKNGAELVAEINTIAGVQARLIDGAEEGRLAAHTVLCTLPFRDGIVVDQGGGSLQLVLVRARRIRAAVSFPLGALRLSDRYLRGTEPPSTEGLIALRQSLVLHFNQVPWLSAGAGQLVAVGGSARTLGKITRRLTGGRFGHGHGYSLSGEALVDRYESLSRMPAEARATVPGLPTHRVDTIVAAALTYCTLLRLGGFGSMHLSTYGIREGVAFRALFGDSPLADPGAAGIRGRLKVAPMDRAPVVPGLSPRERRLFAAALDHPVDWLLDKPIQGFWQEEVGRVADALLQPHQASPEARPRAR